MARAETTGAHFRSTPLWTGWAALCSLLVHGLVYVNLDPAAPVAARKPPKSVVAFSVANARPEPPATPPPPEPESDAPRPTPAPRPAPIPATRHAEPNPAPPAEAPPAGPIDLSGVTLTNDTGGSFTMLAGNGLAREGALRVPASLGRDRPAAPAASVTAPRPEPPRVVPVADLSTRPSPPALDSALQRNYPAEARRRGVGGNAMVRIRIDPDGVVRSVTTLGESAAGFGEACRRTLRGSRWSPPRDRAGRPVATEVRYTCRFVVTP